MKGKGGLGRNCNFKVVQFSGKKYNIFFIQQLQHKTIMKLFLSFLIFMATLFFLSSASCHPTETGATSVSLQDGVITGFDQRACVCCGGLMISFGNKTEPDASQFFLIDNDPSEFGISGTSTFPVYVKAAWTLTTKCAGQHIKITKLVRR